MIKKRWDFIDIVCDFPNRYQSMEISDEDARQMIHDLLSLCKECAELGWEENRQGKIL